MGAPKVWKGSSVCSGAFAARIDRSICTVPLIASSVYVGNGGNAESRAERVKLTYVAKRFRAALVHIAPSLVRNESIDYFLEGNSGRHGGGAFSSLVRHTRHEGMCKASARHPQGSQKIRCNHEPQGRHARRRDRV
jgi:hypothetical protein